MKSPRIILGFGKLSDANFDTKAMTIFGAMTGNAYFPKPMPTLATLNTCIKNYQDSLAAAKTRDKVKVSIKKDMRKALELCLINLANYVTFTAAGDRTILISSGFSIASETRSTKLLGTADNFYVQLGSNSGEVNVGINPVKGFKSYTYLYALAPVNNDAWMHFITNNPEAVITGLEPLKQYSFRIGIAGSNGQVVYTEIITKTVV